MNSPVFSVVIPAFNEERYLPQALESVRRAAAVSGDSIEILVGDNLSTAGTAEIARTHGAQVVGVDIKCISAVRNRAAKAARGRILVFIDADDAMSENAFVEIRRVMDSGRFVGGGVTDVRYDRSSPGIACMRGFVNVSLFFTRLSMFLFYTTPEHFCAIGGFDETLLATEDHDFAKRLKRYGTSKGLRYNNLRSVRVVKSARKFDERGDWYLFQHPVQFVKALRHNEEVIRDFWYEPKRRKP